MTLVVHNSKVVIQSAYCDIVAMCWVKRKNILTCQNSVKPLFLSNTDLRKLQHFLLLKEKSLCPQAGGWKYWTRTVGSWLEEFRQVRQSCMFQSTSEKLMEENTGYWSLVELLILLIPECMGQPQSKFLGCISSVDRSGEHPSGNVFLKCSPLVERSLSAKVSLISTTKMIYF